MSRWKQRVARRLHQIAWKLDPLAVTPLYAKVDCPMTQTGAEVIADAISSQLGHRVGLGYTDVYGVSQRVD